MKVKELINILQKQDPELAVLGHEEIDGGTTFYEIEGATVTHCLRIRSQDGKPGFKYGREIDSAEKLVMIELTSDF